MHWVQIAETDIQQLAVELPKKTADSEVPCVDGPAIAAAREWLDVREEDHDVADIMQIVKMCLKDAKKLKTVHFIKMVTQLTAVMEYVKLRESFQNHPKCQRPCLNASLTIVRRMGKGRANGAYFTCQMCQNESYLLQHRHLPSTKKGAQNGHSLTMKQSCMVYGYTWQPKTLEQ